MLSLTLTDKKQFALDEDEMLLCPYCVTFLLDSESDHCVRSFRVLHVCVCVSEHSRVCQRLRVRSPGNRGHSGLESRAFVCCKGSAATHIQSLASRG